MARAVELCIARYRTFSHSSEARRNEQKINAARKDTCRESRDIEDTASAQSYKPVIAAEIKIRQILIDRVDR